jgi:hypothetical protein
VILYRQVAGAKISLTEFEFQIPVAPGFAGKHGLVSWTAKGKFTVSIRYIWDGASGPTFDTDDTVQASLGHDVGYELMAAGILSSDIFKPVFDLWFYEQLIKDGMIQFRAFAWYKAVKVLGVPVLGANDRIRRAPIPFPPEPPVMWSPFPGYVIRR